MFYAILTKPCILKTALNAISSITEKVQIQADKKGIQLNALDDSHVIFAHLELNANLFNHYSCNELEKINIRTDDLMRVLNCTTSEDRLSLELDEDYLTIRSVHESCKTFKIPLTNMKEGNPIPPSFEYPNRFHIPFKLLKDSVNTIDACIPEEEAVVDEFDNLAPKIRLHVDEDVFIISSADAFGLNVDYLHGEKIDETATSSFSLDLIRKLIKAEGFSDVAEIELGTDMPLHLTLKLVNCDGELSFFIAHRLTE